MSDPIKVARTLRFESLDDILADAKRIVDHPQPRPRGQWTPAQNIWHIARYILASAEGYPPIKVPLVFKFLGPLLRGRVTSKPIKPGFKAPPSFTRHFVASPDTTNDQAIALMQQAIAKQQSAGYIPVNPVFGKLTPDEWTRLHCRHAELHLGLIELPD